MCGQADYTGGPLVQKKMCLAVCIEMVIVQIYWAKGMEYVNYLHLFLFSSVLLPESLGTRMADSVISTGQYQSVAKSSNSKGHTGALSVKSKAPPLPVSQCPPHTLTGGKGKDTSHCKVTNLLVWK